MAQGEGRRSQMQRTINKIRDLMAGGSAVFGHRLPVTAVSLIFLLDKIVSYCRAAIV